MCFSPLPSDKKIPLKRSVGLEKIWEEMYQCKMDMYMYINMDLGGDSSVLDVVRPVTSLSMSLTI